MLLKVLEHTSSASAIGLVRGSPRTPAHLVQHYLVATLRQLPRGFAAGEPTAYYYDRIARGSHRRTR